MRDVVHVEDAASFVDAASDGSSEDAATDSSADASSVFL